MKDELLEQLKQIAAKNNCSLIIIKLNALRK